jgi:hypothetical protein
MGRNFKEFSRAVEEWRIIVKEIFDMLGKFENAK